MTDKRNYIGKQLTWSQAVELFPDLWVSFIDCEFKGATFIKGILVDVISDDGGIKYMEGHWGEKLHIDRITEDTLGDIYMEYLLKKNLDNTSDRPAIYADVVNDMVIRCLMDIGADTPVLAQEKGYLVKASIKLGHALRIRES